MSRQAMVINLRSCIGCNACVVACKVEHNAPNGIFCTSILEKEIGQFPYVGRVFVPVLCNHCEVAPCVDICPTKASFKRNDGVVAIDWGKCIGCKACIEACPYDVRQRVEDNRIVFPDNETVFQHPAFTKIPQRVPMKCDFCIHRKDNGVSKTACEEVCPTAARVSGDLDDPGSSIRSMISRRYASVLLPEKGTKPQVYYIR